MSSMGSIPTLQPIGAFVLDLFWIELCLLDEAIFFSAYYYMEAGFLTNANLIASCLT